MKEHEHGIDCPMCGAHISADTEAELIKEFQAHAKSVHDMEKSDDEVRMMMEGSDEPM
jgi:predicted small metal-binding protein